MLTVKASAMTAATASTSSVASTAAVRTYWPCTKLLSSGSTTNVIALPLVVVKSSRPVPSIRKAISGVPPS